MWSLSVIVYCLVVMMNSADGNSRSALNYDICDQHLCVGLGSSPAKDCIEDKSCLVLLSVHIYDTQEWQSHYVLSAITRTSSDSHTSKYYSMAFSEDTTMGDDLVTDCYVTSDGKPRLSTSYNVGKSNDMNEEFRISLHSIKTSQNNGVVTCEWKSHRNRTHDGRTFDLKLKYHILLAVGELNSDDGQKSYHDLKLATSEAVSLLQVGAIGTSDPIYFIKIHGSLMVIAWIGTVSLGIVFARYFKTTWMSSELCGVKIWFAFHRSLMVISVVLMIIAQICIFYYVGEYRIGWHQIFGSIAFTLALLNPIGALLRPHPDAPNRWIFNWGHWFGGNVGHITAIIAIFLATTLKLADLPKPFLWTVISFVIFYVIVHLILQFHTFFMQNRKTHDIAMQDMSNSGDDHPIGSDGPGSGFRRFILGIYGIGLLAFVVALVSLIILPKDTLNKMAIT
ncbi:putative ferric-chelate reductase 1 homolog isoform X2 [Oppia nitens]|uniref:putative ferric-chelate reductase 1 homolog isoform X2 n=1 Tax=Oppia nitens TaxID=1686743 RepID=UPI0023DA1C97|nr:putative ferric-chelate reductase 1 homolog isoform X2 [Oppia nitens]